MIAVLTQLERDSSEIQSEFEKYNNSLGFCF